MTETNPRKQARFTHADGRRSVVEARQRRRARSCADFKRIVAAIENNQLLARRLDANGSRSQVR